MPLVGTGVIIGSDVGASEAEGAAVGFGVAVFVSLPPPPPPPPPPSLPQSRRPGSASPDRI